MCLFSPEKVVDRLKHRVNSSNWSHFFTMIWLFYYNVFLYSDKFNKDCFKTKQRHRKQRACACAQGNPEQIINVTNSSVNEKADIPTKLEKIAL